MSLFANLGNGTSNKPDFTNIVSQLYYTGKYSDLVIKCQDKKFEVHRAIVCTQSKPLAAAIGHGFKEATTGEIVLEEDDADSVDMMIRFLYNGNYGFFASGKSIAKSTTEGAGQSFTSSNATAIDPSTSKPSIFGEPKTGKPELGAPGSKPVSLGDPPTSKRDLDFLATQSTTTSTAPATAPATEAIAKLNNIGQTLKNMIGNSPSPLASSSTTSQNATPTSRDTSNPTSSVPSRSNPTGTALPPSMPVFGSNREQGDRDAILDKYSVKTTAKRVHRNKAPSTIASTKITAKPSMFDLEANLRAPIDKSMFGSATSSASQYYNIGNPTNTTMKPISLTMETPRNVFGISPEIFEEHLVMHAKVYIIAEKYDIQPLKKLACEKYKTSTYSGWNSSHFVKSLELIFDGTPDTKEMDSIRYTAINIASSHVSELFDRGEFITLCQERGDIATAILRAVTQKI